jgi:hypothetical protein
MPLCASTIVYEVIIERGVREAAIGHGLWEALPNTVEVAPNQASSDVLISRRWRVREINWCGHYEITKLPVAVNVRIVYEPDVVAVPPVIVKPVASVVR